MPATSQLEWLSSTTAMIVLFWSRATRDLLRSFDWGIAALHRLDAATKLPCLAARPIASIGPSTKRDWLPRSTAWGKPTILRSMIHRAGSPMALAKKSQQVVECVEQFQRYLAARPLPTAQCQGDPALSRSDFTTPVEV